MEGSLRWYGASCNIFKDEQFQKSNYNHGLKNSKLLQFAPKIHDKMRQKR